MTNTFARRAREAYPFQLELNTRFADTDMAGHLNNASIFRYYQDGLARFLLDGVPELFPALGRTLRLTHCDASYDGQVYFLEVLTVTSGVVQVGEHWVRIAQALFQRGECVGLCDAVLTSVDEQGQPLAFNPGQQAQLESRRIHPENRR